MTEVTVNRGVRGEDLQTVLQTGYTAGWESKHIVPIVVPSSCGGNCAITYTVVFTRKKDAPCDDG